MKTLYEILPYLINGGISRKSSWSKDHWIYWDEIRNSIILKYCDHHSEFRPQLSREFFEKREWV